MIDRSCKDKGSGLIEVLLSILLLGMVLAPTLLVLRASAATASTVKDRANAQAWLQTAADVLYTYPHEDCGTVFTSRESEVRELYEDVVRDTENPLGWDEENIRIVPPVLFWDGKQSFQATCFDDVGVINLQLIKIEVTNPEGEVVESVEVVKG